MKILNITNGDGAANIIKQSTVVGDVLPWRDPMHHGPFPSKLSLAELGKLRAAYLAGPDADPTEIERDFQLRDQHLRASENYDKITLWFEHDLLDQLQILQILDWFSGPRIQGAILDMICIDRFPGKSRFRGIGELSPEEMASLTELRQPVTDNMLAIATSGWAAFRSNDPRDLLAFLNHDLSELPFLTAALRRHIEEFPDASTGLNRTERQLLGLMADGVHAPQQLFLQNMEMETTLFIGDWPTYRTLDSLCASGLAACNPPPFRFPSYSREKHAAFNMQHLSITEAGCRVLNGMRDAFDLMQRDGWLGGVNVVEFGAIWTWDKETAEFLRRAI